VPPPTSAKAISLLHVLTPGAALLRAQASGAA
jgi:hypothetical protein